MGVQDATGSLTGSGRVRFAEVRGASGVTGRVMVVLPRSYGAPGSAHRRYPVIEAFHGYPGVPRQWLSPMDLPQLLDAAVAAHQVSDAFIVAPALEVPRGRDTECVDGGAGSPRLEEWLTQDVPAYVESRFRVDRDRRGWATIGLSMGGWCAAMATMLHPAQFSAAVVLGGYFHPLFGSWQPFAPDSAAGRRYDLVRLERTSPQPVSMWVQTSQVDPFSWATSRAFLAAIAPPTSLTDVVLQHAGHRISVWVSQEPAALAWLGRTVPGSAPAATA